jgi:hypothetical protein
MGGYLTKEATSAETKNVITTTTITTTDFSGSNEPINVTTPMDQTIEEVPTTSVDTKEPIKEVAEEPSASAEEPLPALEDPKAETIIAEEPKQDDSNCKIQESVATSSDTGSSPGPSKKKKKHKNRQNN